MVTFETKVWEGDWRFVLAPGHLQTMIRRCRYRFAQRILHINNVRDPEPVRLRAQQLVDEGIIDRFCVVADHADQALRHFGLTREQLGKGYYYSIAELVALQRCETPYLLHFSGDSIMEDRDVPWIDQALGLFVQRPEVVVANPTWNFKYDEAAQEAHALHPLFFVGFGFSDQCYLVPTAVFQNRIYGERHPASERYPAYGGDLFEKRVDAYMRNHSVLRLTSRHISYAHRNFPQARSKRLKARWASALRKAERWLR
jgi:hypothetical protein